MPFNVFEKIKKQFLDSHRENKIEIFFGYLEKHMFNTLIIINALS